MPKSRIKSPWAARLERLFNAMKWTWGDPRGTFGAGYMVVRRVRNGGIPKVQFVRRLIHLEHEYAEQIKEFESSRGLQKQARLHRGAYVAAAKEIARVEREKGIQSVGEEVGRGGEGSGGTAPRVVHVAYRKGLHAPRYTGDGTGRPAPSNRRPVAVG